MPLSHGGKLLQPVQESVTEGLENMFGENRWLGKAFRERGRTDGGGIDLGQDASPESYEPGAGLEIGDGA